MVFAHPPLQLYVTYVPFQVCVRSGVVSMGYMHVYVCLHECVRT